MPIKVAVAQMDPKLAQVEANRQTVKAMLDQALQDGVDFIVFPEAALTGYGFSAVADAYAVAETIPGETTAALTAVLAKHNTAEKPRYAVVGMLERGDTPATVYNSAVLLNAAGVVGVYRKAHLPFLGVDRLTTEGDSGFLVWDTPLGRIGIAVCYDLRFPETLRALALQGADIIALPTNWPDGSQNAPQFVTRTRALENRVFVMACNRCGEEGDFWFFGHSQITDPRGNVLVEARAIPGIFTADIEPAQARVKRIVLRPGEFELDTVGDRRPDLYGSLVE